VNSAGKWKSCYTKFSGFIQSFFVTCKWHCCRVFVFLLPLVVVVEVMCCQFSSGNLLRTPSMYNGAFEQSGVSVYLCRITHVYFPFVVQKSPYSFVFLAASLL